jgi:nucleoid DNA-binding protein
MNKGDLINKIAESAGITKSQADDALGAVLDGITEALKNDDSVVLVVILRRVKQFKLQPRL